MAGKYTRWVSEGTITATQKSNAVTGYDTHWLSAGISPGDFFTTDEGDNLYEIAELVDDNHITLTTPYIQETKTKGSYSIARRSLSHVF